MLSFDFFAVYIFIIGLLLGSFYNVCIYRIPREESIIFPPSHCTKCNTRLKVFDLVPVFSYIFLGGKCRYCGSKISPRYAIVEFMTALIFTVLYLKFGLAFEFFKFAVLTSFIIVIGLIDHDTTDVYAITTWPGIICGLIFLIVAYFLDKPFLDGIYGALIGGGVIAAIVVLTQGMGHGDVEICALAGLYLGFKGSIVMLFFSFVIGGIVGIILIATKKKSRKDYIPFGPYIALGALVALLFGEQIFNWYTCCLLG
ncbi:MAG: prepilin peptidase [Clostridiales bacterium]|uniref:prepilin peptidase n=1 Tax=Clostridium sp. N3C TaxID=1776758 RepID=UPI00092DF89B|nr:A24 family peptidase [Clostridium sp. N3C]NLZ47937.1 prepilin peptidase [Clostridiales bacterium]SCN22475.1 Late competence protein ComC [Clostridium sp. N3C]